MRTHGHTSRFSLCTCRLTGIHHGFHSARADSRAYITVFTLHVQTHGHTSRFSLCTCRLTGIHHGFHSATRLTGIHHGFHDARADSSHTYGFQQLHVQTHGTIFLKSRLTKHINRFSLCTCRLTGIHHGFHSARADSRAYITVFTRGARHKH